MMARVIEPEWLDALPAEDASAVRSRADLRRVNRLMNNARIVADALRSLAPKRVLDLGAGDGWFAVRLAMLLNWHDVECVLLDQSTCVSETICQQFNIMNCRVSVMQCDVLDGLGDIGRFDVIFTNLFLHHFSPADLKQLLADVAAHCRVFVACEPRRSLPSLAASRLLGFIGCNYVTRHDAITSVRAGFRDGELTALWPANAGWSNEERAAGMFSHLFVAHKL